MTRFLKELASALGKFAMYPDGHSTLGPAVSELSDRLSSLLARRDRLELRVRRDRLVVGDRATDVQNPLLSGLADRLHRHQVSALAFSRGVDRDELVELLSALSRRPTGDGDRLGLEAAADRWPHLEIAGQRYDPLRLDSGVSPETDTSVPPSADTPPVGSRLAGSDLFDSSPSAVARAVEAQLEDEDLDRVAALQLLRMTERLGQAAGRDAEAVRDRLSRVVLSLPTEALGDILDHLEEDRGDEELLLAAARSMEVEATLKLVQAAASRREDGEAIAEWLLELVLKLSMYGRRDRGAGPSRTQEVDELIDRILEAWDLEDPRPPVYQTALHRMARNPPQEAGLSPRRARSIFISPERVLKMGLELDSAAGHVRDAAEQMLAAERFDALADLLATVPAGHGLAARLRDRMARPEVLERVLDADPPGFALAEQLVEAGGADLAPPLLEALSSSRSASRLYWRKVFNLLVEIGGPVLGLIPERLEDERWYVRRNMLSLVRDLPGRPEGFSALSHLDDEDPRVRAEALALALENPAERDAAIEAGLEDRNPRLVGLALSAAEAECPASVIPSLAEVVADSDHASSHRMRAARLLARAEAPEALDALLDVVWRSKWFFWRELAPGSPLVQEAMAALRRGWRDHPAAREALEAAARSADERLRRAAHGETATA